VSQVEGIEEFSSTWEKVQGATTQNLKEKYEAELKKDIKKLQRYREQIKTWASSSDVKLKQPLLDARRDIEVEMERFKALEKETKTKAYSKEGLQLQAKRSKSELERKHPNYKGIVWMQEMVDRLQAVVDELAEEQEALGGGRLRGRAQQEYNALQRKIEHHQHHVEKLIYGKDRLSKCLISLGQVEELKEDVLYYVESHDADDFFENEFMYDILDEAPPEVEEEPVVDEEVKREPPPAKKETASAKAPPSPAAERAAKKKAEQANAELTKKAAKQAKLDQQAAVAAARAKANANAASASSSSNQQPLLKASDRAKSGPSAVSAAPSGPPGYPPLGSTGDDSNKPSLAAMLKSQKSNKRGGNNPNQPPLMDMSGNSNPQLGSQHGPSSSNNNNNNLRGPTSNQAPSVNISGGQGGQPIGLGNKNIPQGGQGQGQMGLGMPGQGPQGLSSGPLFNNNPQQQRGPPQPKPQGPQLRIPPGLEQYMQEALYEVKSQLDRRQRMLQPSLRNLPQPADSERKKAYAPRNPYRTPSYFPSMPDPIFDEPAMFERFSHDTLFFIFYFQQGTPHQYLAARELKKHSWRYHKKHLTWFQRHGDPKTTSEDFEEGSYRYFEYGMSWRGVIKENFRFEYAHLEE
jgi:CCR4-NOT transcription complex subunit 3